jgi:hypothetical protein
MDSLVLLVVDRVDCSKQNLVSSFLSALLTSMQGVNVQTSKLAIWKTSPFDCSFTRQGFRNVPHGLVLPSNKSSSVGKRLVKNSENQDELVEHHSYLGICQSHSFVLLPSSPREYHLEWYPQEDLLRRNWIASLALIYHPQSQADPRRRLELGR